MGGGKSFNVERMVKENIESAKPKSLNPEDVVTAATSFATGVTQTKETYRQIKSLITPKEIPVPEIPSLNGMSAADITLKAQAAREEERRKSLAKRGRQSTIVTGPLGIQSAASTTRGPI